MKIAFVPPRFGPGVLGGAEAVMREAALGFAHRGHDVEVLTTCALDHYSWANELPEGAQEHSGLLVRRFPVVRHPSRAALKAQLSVQAGQLPSLDDQVSWLGFQFSLPGLFEHLVRSGEHYDAIVFAPYLFWTASVCMPSVAGRAVVLPCLHDETYARLGVLRPVFELPALVWLLSGPEHALAHRLGPLARRHSVTGAGVPVPRNYRPERFIEKYKLARPFLIYAGRREEGKGTAWMLDAFARAVLDGGADVDLVVLGKGDLAGPLATVPAEVRQRVHDIGFVPDDLRDDGLAAALAYVQPSIMESFSRTVMESWLAGTPVIANAASEVVAWHCQRSGGGVTFDDGATLARQVDVVQGPLGTAMAQAGRRYVLENYTWPVVLDRMEASLSAITSAVVTPAAGGAPRVAGGTASTGPGPVAPGAIAPRTLVVGSYPPVPGVASAATLAAVRRRWADGREVIVASPRPSAAGELVPASGTALGAALVKLARRYGCDQLVLGIEPGWPFVGRTDERAAVSLARSLATFKRVELVVTGDALLSPATWMRLLPLAEAVVVGSQAEAERLRSLGAREVPVVPPGAGWLAGYLCTPDGTLGAGPTEPGALLLKTRARRWLGAVARGVLGRHAPVVRVHLSRLKDRLS